MPTPEQTARAGIDAQLAAAGWAVQDMKELNLSASRGIAVREMQSHGGPADYILFVDGKALGIVEAKKEGTTLSAVAEQSARYTAAMKWIPQRWADPLPFTYESTGIETNFRDQRDPDSRSRPVFAFHTPEHLLELVQQPDTLRARLRQFPALNTAPLRECQIDAVSSLEKSLAANRPRALIQMATGSGKTFTAVTQAYRLIKHAGAKRILFLVDRGNLGRQTVNEFQHFTLKTNPLANKDLDDFKECYGEKNAGCKPALHTRKETERFKKFTYAEIVARDKANLDILWLKDDSLEDSDNLPAPALLAAEIVESLEAALAEFRAVEEALTITED